MIEIKRYRRCGSEPVWLLTPLGTGIGCPRSNCRDITVYAPTPAEAIRRWNEIQRVME